MTGEAESIFAALARSAASGRARIATRTCDGRLLAAAGVNLKSVRERPRLATEAASLGSAPPGVKVERGSKLTATAGAFLFTGAATAGDSKRPTAETAASISALLERPRLGNQSSCFESDIVGGA